MQDPQILRKIEKLVSVTTWHQINQWNKMVGLSAGLWNFHFGNFRKTYPIQKRVHKRSFSLLERDSRILTNAFKSQVLFMRQFLCNSERGLNFHGIFYEVRTSFLTHVELKFHLYTLRMGQKTVLIGILILCGSFQVSLDLWWNQCRKPLLF